MLAEKFFLLLETIKSRTYADGGQRMVSTSRHVPMELPNAKHGPPEASAQQKSRQAGLAAPFLRSKIAIVSRDHAER
jgi:hypothetical protein